jgi:hypothetical protein
MLHIVNIDLSIRYFQGEIIRTTINHIVEADCEEDAKDKIERHYESKDVTYCVTHYVNINYINEIIK